MNLGGHEDFKTSCPITIGDRIINGDYCSFFNV